VLVSDVSGYVWPRGSRQMQTVRFLNGLEWKTKRWLEEYRLGSLSCCFFRSVGEW